MRLLKQNTAFTFRIGPFVDATDGVTAETALSIAQADMQISKNGGAFAQTSAAPTTTHDADGWYQCPLTATDTNTLGPLTVQIVMAGALPVWEHFMVVPANVYDSLVAGTDRLAIKSGIRKNQALANFPFLMTDSTNHNPATGLTVTATRSIDGAAFGAGTIANMTEVANGVYQCDLGAGDLNGDTIALRFTATGADDLIVTLITEP
ncbi:MAG: hypothetical protein KIT60_06980 [Burkholderiaceae bacterium]|nr:hypothetical protein [Burkholderiaceae bacterium]